MRNIEKSEWEQFGQVGSLNSLKHFIANPAGKLLAKENYELVIIPEGIDGCHGISIDGVLNHIDISFGESMKYKIKLHQATDNDYFKIVESLLAAKIIWRSPWLNKAEW